MKISLDLNINNHFFHHHHIFMYSFPGMWLQNSSLGKYFLLEWTFWEFEVNAMSAFSVQGKNPETPQKSLPMGSDRTKDELRHLWEVWRYIRMKLKAILVKFAPADYLLVKHRLFNDRERTPWKNSGLVSLWYELLWCNKFVPHLYLCKGICLSPQRWWLIGCFSRLIFKLLKGTLLLRLVKNWFSVCHLLFVPLCKARVWKVSKNMFTPVSVLGGLLCSAEVLSKTFVWHHMRLFILLTCCSKRFTLWHPLHLRFTVAYLRDGFISSQRRNRKIYEIKSKKEKEVVSLDNISNV